MFGIVQDPLQDLHIKRLSIQPSQFHFTAHQKIFIFFLSGSSSRIPLINYLFCIGDFICLHCFLCVLQQNDWPRWGQIKFLNNFKLYEVTWIMYCKKKERANITHPCCMFCRRLGPWSCNSKGYGVPISHTPPPSPLT